MSADRTTSVVVERRLMLVAEAGNKFIRYQICAPYYDRSRCAWRCNVFRRVGRTCESTRALGEDAFECMRFAFDLVQVLMARDKKRFGEALRWPNGTEFIADLEAHFGRKFSE